MQPVRSASRLDRKTGHVFVFGLTRAIVSAGNLKRRSLSARSGVSYPKNKNSGASQVREEPRPKDVNRQNFIVRLTAAKWGFWFSKSKTLIRERVDTMSWKKYL